MLENGIGIMTTVFNSRKQDRSLAEVKDLEDPLEKRLIGMLRDGICDLYTVIAVLDANGRIPADPGVGSHSNMRVVWPA